MPTEEEKRIGIPESITINGVVYIVKDTPELLGLIQAVSKVEKDKLYSQFESLKSQIENLKKVRVVDSTQPTDLKGIVEELKSVFVTKEDLAVTLKDSIKEVVQPVLNATEQNRQNELDEYRKTLIKNNLDTCIPEMVAGNTREELDAALAKSIKIRASYPSPSSAVPQGHVTDPLIQAQAEQMEARIPTPAAPIASAPPVVPRRPSPEVTGIPPIKQMSMDEFSRKRDELARQLEASYGGGSL